MRVGIFVGNIQDLKMGGSAIYQGSLIEKISELKSSHEFFIFYEGDESNKINLVSNNSASVKFVNIGRNKKSNKLKNFFYKKTKNNSLNEKILENKIELLWFMVPAHHFVEVPYILTVWDLQHRLQPYFPEVSLSGWVFDKREKFYQNAIQKASYVIIGNSEGARQIQQFYGYPEKLIKTIPFFIPQYVFGEDDKGFILQNNGLKKNEYLFYPAQFWPHKNHIRILQAALILKQKGLNLKIVFSGSDKGNLAYIKQKVNEYNLQDIIKFLGFVEQNEMITLYKNAFAMTFLSMFGPDNLPPLEAIALKCPVICADAAGMKDQLKNAALFFDPLDSNDLAQKILDLYQDKSLKENLSQNSVELIRRCTVENYLNDVMQIINEFKKIRECWSSDKKYAHL